MQADDFPLARCKLVTWSHANEIRILLQRTRIRWGTWTRSCYRRNLQGCRKEGARGYIAIAITMGTQSQRAAPKGSSRVSDLTCPHAPFHQDGTGMRWKTRYRKTRFWHCSRAPGGRAYEQQHAGHYPSYHALLKPCSLHAG